MTYVYPSKKPTMKYTVYYSLQKGQAKRKSFASKKEADAFAKNYSDSIVEKKKPEAYEQMKAFYLASQKGEKLVMRPIQIIGKGRYSRYGEDHSNEYKRYAKEIGLAFTKWGNDAPMRGVTGTFLVFEKE